MDFVEVIEYRIRPVTEFAVLARAMSSSTASRVHP